MKAQSCTWPLGIRHKLSLQPRQRREPVWRASSRQLQTHPSQDCSFSSLMAFERPSPQLGVTERHWWIISCPQHPLFPPFPAWRRESTSVFLILLPGATSGGGGGGCGGRHNGDCTQLLRAAATIPLPAKMDVSSSLGALSLSLLSRCWGILKTCSTLENVFLK